VRDVRVGLFSEGLRALFSGGDRDLHVRSVFLEVVLPRAAQQGLRRDDQCLAPSGPAATCEVLDLCARLARARIGEIQCAGARTQEFDTVALMTEQRRAIARVQLGFLLGSWHKVYQTEYLKLAKVLSRSIPPQDPMKNNTSSIGT